MANQNNPAKRLYTILTEAKAPANNQKSVIDTWADVFEIDINEPDGFLKLTRQFGQLHSLVFDVKMKVQKMEVNHGLYLRHFHKIEHVIRADQLGASWGGLVSQLDDATMDNIEYCSELLSNDFSENDISDQMLELKEKIDALSEDILSSTLEESIKDFILNELEIIRRGIFEYRLRGAASVRESVATAIGSIVMNQEVSSSNNDDGYFSKLKKIILEADKLSSTALRLKTLAAPMVSKAIEWLG